MSGEPCPTVMGYSAEPMPPMPRFHASPVAQLDERVSFHDNAGQKRRKFPRPEVGDRVGCLTVVGVEIGTWGRGGFSATYAETVCTCGATQTMTEFNLRKRFLRGGKCIHIRRTK